MAKDFKEKTITINLSKVFLKPVTKRVIGAKHVICECVKKETRLENFKISNELNELLWSKGRYNSARKITVKVIKEKDVARIMLPSEKYETKKDKTDKKAESVVKETTPEAKKTESTPKAEKETVEAKTEKVKEKKTTAKKE